MIGCGFGSDCSAKIFRLVIYRRIRVAEQLILSDLFKNGLILNFLIFRDSGSILASEYSFAPEKGQTTGLPESTFEM